MIKKPVVGTVKPYLAGVLQSSGWSVDTTTGVLTFLASPAVGVAVTADFEFDVPVRFDTVMLPFTNSKHQMRYANKFTEAISMATHNLSIMDGGR